MLEILFDVSETLDRWCRVPEDCSACSRPRMRPHNSPSATRMGQSCDGSWPFHALSLNVCLCNDDPRPRGAPGNCSTGACHPIDNYQCGVTLHNVRIETAQMNKPPGSDRACCICSRTWESLDGEKVWVIVVSKCGLDATSGKLTWL